MDNFPSFRTRVWRSSKTGGRSSFLTGRIKRSKARSFVLWRRTLSTRMVVDFRFSVVNFTFTSPALAFEDVMQCEAVSTQWGAIKTPFPPPQWTLKLLRSLTGYGDSPLRTSWNLVGGGDGVGGSVALTSQQPNNQRLSIGVINVFMYRHYRIGGLHIALFYLVATITADPVIWQIGYPPDRAFPRDTIRSPKLNSGR